MTTPATTTQPKPRGARRSKADDEAAARNPDILCHQIGLCKNLAELQAFISKHNLLNVESDPRFDDRMKVVIEAALDTMTEVLQSEPGTDLATIFDLPKDLTEQGWKMERDGVAFRFVRGQLATDGYVILDEAADAARKLRRREEKRGADKVQHRPSPDAVSDAELAETKAADPNAVLEQRDRLKADGWKFRDYADGRWAATHKARGLKTGKSESLVETILAAARLAEEHTAEIEDAGNHADDAEAERRRQIAARGGQVNESGVYVEDVETVLVKTTKKLGLVELEAVKDRVDGKWRSGGRYQSGGRAPWFDNGLVVGQPFDTREEALAAAAYEVAQAVPDLGSYMERFVEGLDIPLGELSSSRRAQLDAACGSDCGHSTEEHNAFDAGLVAGEQGYDADGCPHESGSLREAWLTGHSVGVGNRSADPATNGDGPGVTAADGDVVEDSSPAEPRTRRECIEVKLTDTDVAAKARKAAAIEVQIEEVEAEMKRSNDGYKQKIGGLREEHRELMRAINRGHDALDLDVYERRDFERKVVETVRADSDEVVGTRPMKPTEYQQPLPSI